VKLIVGLGNPGRQYDRTRHNAGYLVVDRLAERHAPGAVARGKFHGLAFDAPSIGVGRETARALLIKPTTYMNCSGLCVAEAVRFYKVAIADDLLVIVDDVALPIGATRLRARGGTGGHNGLADITEKLGTDHYARLRIGIGEPGRQPQSDYVLGRFSSEQWEAVQPALDRAAKIAEAWAVTGVVEAMNHYNALDQPSGSKRSSASGAADSTPTKKNVNKKTNSAGATPDAEQPNEESS